jgi:hypothetical protein
MPKFKNMEKNTPRDMGIHGRNCEDLENRAREHAPKGDIIYNGLKILRKKPEKLTLRLKSGKYKVSRFF